MTPIYTRYKTNNVKTVSTHETKILSRTKGKLFIIGHMLGKKRKKKKKRKDEKTSTELLPYTCIYFSMFPLTGVPAVQGAVH